MKTNVMMERRLFNGIVRQKSSNGFFSLTDLEKAGNAYRLSNGMTALKLSQYLNKDETKEFIKEVEERYGVAKTASRGRYSGTWAHPLVFIDMSLYFHPKLKLEVYEWIKDELIKYRNDSGDSYKNMCGALLSRMSNLRNAREYIAKVATIIRIACEVKSWETATEEQLKTRDKIHDLITMLTKVMRNPNECVRLAVLEKFPHKDYSLLLNAAKEEFNQAKK
jgi:hypothetical protein